MTRTMCAQCGYPQTVCICDHVQRIENRLHVIILQHPHEQKHAKNSVRLLQLSLASITVYHGETASDFKLLRDQIAKDPTGFALIYPSNNSAALEQQPNQALTRIRRLLFIDATWRKAYKIYQLNSWLHAIPQFHFQSAPGSQYGIRKSPSEQSLSTLEAVAYSLRSGFNEDHPALLNLFARFQQRVFARHPKAQTSDVGKG